MSNRAHDKAKIVPIHCIEIRPDRGRKVFTRIEELAESLKKVGFINPICCEPHPNDPNKYYLIAGERRFRAAVHAGLLEVPITFKPDLTEAEQKIIELDENVCRADLSWDEQCELHRQIDEALKSSRPGWDQKKTAQFLNLSEGHVSDQIKMAKQLKAKPELLAKVKGMPMRAAMQIIDRGEEAKKLERLVESNQITITTDLRLGSCLDIIRTLPSASVDMLLTDPPYGLDKLETIREQGSSGALVGHATMSEHHNMKIEDVLGLLTLLGPELARVMKPGAHGYVFTGIQHFGAFVEALAPLQVQYPALVWDRGKSTSPGYGYNYLNRCEYIIHFHNPPRQRRLADNEWNILPYSEVPTALRRYPTEKPVELLCDLIKQSSHMGELILDPFAGSASTLVAARKLGRRSLGCEINPESWKRAQLYLAQGDGTSLLPTDKLDEARKTALMGD